MTFRGNLLLYSLWYELHPFENLRRRHHCHGLTHLSGQNAKFFTGFWVKILWAVHLPGQSVRQVVAVYAPGDRTHTGVWHPAGNEQGPAATTESACAKRRCALHPGVVLPGCRSAGHGATGAARPERSLQAGVLRQGWKPAGAETAPLAPFTTARPPGDARESHKQERNGKKRKKKNSNHRNITSGKTFRTHHKREG